MKRQLKPVIMALAFWPLTFSSIAQENRGLSVGDTCPDILIKKIINSTVAGAHLSSWKGRMVLLDFMTSRCSSCIKALPKMDSLQQLFKNRIFIAAVTQEKSPAVEKLLGMDYLKSCRVPFIIEDTVLHQTFPHRAIPHIVWLDENRVVKAITYSQYVTAENIELALNNKKINWLIKNEWQEFENSTELLTWNTVMPSKPAKLYYSVVTSNLPGVRRSETETLDSLSQAKTFSIKNYAVLPLYQVALRLINWQIFPGKTFLLESGDSSRFFYSAELGYRDQWDLKNTWCYEICLPATESNYNMSSNMIADLNRFVNLNAKFEYRLAEVWRIVPALSGKASTGSAGKPKRSTKISDFIFSLNIAKDFPMVIYDGQDRSIELSMRTGSIQSKSDLDCILEENNLIIVPEKKEIKVFVVR